MRRVICAGFLLMVLGPGRTDAAFEYPVVVTQPVLTHDEELWLVPVTYMRYSGAFDLAMPIHFVCYPNVVENDRGEPENRNCAAQLGIKLRVNRTERQMFDNWDQGGRSDTLDVVLDVSAVAGVEKHGGIPVSAIVEATFECILINGARSKPLLDYVTFSVEGSQEYEYMRGLYPLDDTASCKARRAPDYDLTEGRFGAHWRARGDEGR
jgi:hypothetical protein